MKLALLTCALAIIVSHTICSAQDSENDLAQQRYKHVLYSSTAEWLSTQPFLLRVDFELYDLDGKSSEKGTAEESWTQSDGKVIRLQSPSLSEDGSPDGAKPNTRESFLVHQAINAITRPFPKPSSIGEAAVKEFDQDIGGISQHCFSLNPGAESDASKIAYCTDIDNHLTAITGPFYQIERSDFRKYRGHEIPAELKLSYEGKTALVLHMSEMDSLPDEPTLHSKSKISVGNEVIPGHVIAGAIIKKKNPDYPKQARKSHIGGSVIITALISKQGTIACLDAIASPDALLTKSAIEAVRKWTYRPYLLDGKPIDVDTTIIVNYNLNGFPNKK